MADITPREITKGESLAFGKKETTPPAWLNLKQKESQDRANLLRKVDQEGKKPEEIFRTNIGRDEFTTQNGEALVSQLGGGEAKLKDGKANLERGTASSEARENFDRAQNAIKKVSRVLEYTQISKEATRDGKDPKDIYEKPPYNMRLSDWESRRDEVADLLLQDGGVAARFDQELTGLSPAEKRAYIDATLSQDYDLNKIIVDKMSGLLDRANRLDPIRKTAERGQLDRDKVRIEQNMKDTYDIVFRTIGIDPASTDASDLKNTIEPYLKSGASQKEVQDQIFRTLVAGKGINSIQDFDVYDKATYEFQDKQTQIILRQQLISSMQQGGQQLARNEQAQIRTWTAEIARFTNEMGVAAARVNDITNKIGLNQQEIEQKLIELKKVRENVYGAQQPDGTRSGGITEATGRLIARQNEYNNINSGIDASDSTQEAQQERANRLSQEGQIIRELEGVMFDSVSDLLISRHQELGRIEQVRITKAIEEAKKRGDKWSEDKLKQFKDLQQNLYLEFNPKTKKYETHRDRLEKHAHLLAEKGEDGVREIFARSIDYSEDENKEKQKIARELYGTPGTTIDVYSTLNESDKSNVEQTYEERKKKFDTLYSENAQAVKERFFKDFFTTRGLRDRLGMGDLSLAPDEWKRLDQNFGELINGGIESSKEAKAALEKIREKGINIAPGTPLKWLLWALLAAVGAAGLGTAASLSRKIA